MELEKKNKAQSQQKEGTIKDQCVNKLENNKKEIIKETRAGFLRREAKLISL